MPVASRHGLTSIADREQPEREKEHTERDRRGRLRRNRPPVRCARGAASAAAATTPHASRIAPRRPTAVLRLGEPAASATHSHAIARAASAAWASSRAPSVFTSTCSASGVEEVRVGLPVEDGPPARLRPAGPNPGRQRHGLGSGRVNATPGSAPCRRPPSKRSASPKRPSGVHVAPSITPLLPRPERVGGDAARAANRAGRPPTSPTRHGAMPPRDRGGHSAAHLARGQGSVVDPHLVELAHEVLAVRAIAAHPERIVRVAELTADRAARYRNCRPGRAAASCRRRSPPGATSGPIGTAQPRIDVLGRPLEGAAARRKERRRREARGRGPRASAARRGSRRPRRGCDRARIHGAAAAPAPRLDRTTATAIAISPTAGRSPVSIPWVSDSDTTMGPCHGRQEEPRDRGGQEADDHPGLPLAHTSHPSYNDWGTPRCASERILATARGRPRGAPRRGRRTPPAGESCPRHRR